MARKPRIQYPGASCHGMSPGGHQVNIFKDDPDSQAFIRTLCEECGEALTKRYRGPSP